MGGYRVPGAVGASRDMPIDAGTLSLIATPAPGPVGTAEADHVAFERTIDEIEAEFTNAGSHLVIDASARQAYQRRIRDLADDLRLRARTGRITWLDAAKEANEARNLVMAFIRGRSTPVGRARAEFIKSTGRTLNEMVARKVLQLFGPQARFANLSAAQQDRVFAAVVEAAGKSDPVISARMLRLSRVGRGLVIVSIALSVYSIATSENQVDTAEREVAVNLAGVAGGMAGGALAGLACGPGAPVCVTVGAFVGGAMAAFGVDAIW